MASAQAKQIASRIWHRDQTIGLRRDEAVYEAAAEVIDEVLTEQYEQCRKLIKLRDENQKVVRTDFNKAR